MNGAIPAIDSRRRLRKKESGVNRRRHSPSFSSHSRGGSRRESARMAGVQTAKFARTVSAAYWYHRDDQNELEVMAAETPSETNTPPSNVPRGLKPWVKGQSGNPSGRPRIEPRVRRYARKYDMRMCKVLAEIAEDPKQPVSERRRAAMDLIAVGSGRPATTQELIGKAGAPVGPLVSVNLGAALTPESAMRLMTEGVLPADPEQFRPAIEGQATEVNP
jgi:hypothetical protein